MNALSYEEQKQRKRKEAAYHEAGHIFMLALFGHQIIDASISEEDNGEIKFKGEANYSPYVDPASLVDLSEKHAFACIAFAGSSAEDKLKDWEKDERGMSIFAGGSDDYTQYQYLKLEKGSTKPLLEFTNEIIDEHWPVISKLAEDLYQLGSLNSQEIEVILDITISTHPVSKYLQAKRSQYEQHLKNIKLELFKKPD